MSKSVLFFVMFTIAPFFLFSSGIKEEMNNAEGAVKITGKIEIYGSEPHTFVGIVDENGTEYAVHAPSREDELRRLQGRLIEFTVVFLDDPQVFGSLFLKGGTVEPLGWVIIR